MKENKKIVKMELKLNKQKVLLDYWYRSEKIEMATLAFIFTTILLPLIKNFSFNLNDWITWFFVFEIIIIIAISIWRLRYYRKKQEAIKKSIEKLKV